MLDGVPVGAWVRIVGSNFEAEPLDTHSLRKRSAKLPAYLQRPKVQKLITPDGRAFKLLSVPAGNNRVREILKHLSPINNDCEFLPRILWSDSCTILFEYIDGEFADISTDHFAIALGEALASIHRIRKRNISKLMYRVEFLHNLKSLKQHNVLDANQCDVAKSFFYDHEPAAILRGLDYFDFARDNFVISKEGSLRLIDAGAFQSNRPIGQFLVGSPFFYLLNMDVFSESYLKSGGHPFLIQNQAYLRLFHYVMKAGQKARRYASTADKTTSEAKQNFHRLMRHRNRLAAFIRDSP